VSRIITADCVEHMASMPPSSIDAIVTDPPYGLAFMGKDFDKLGTGAAQTAWHRRWADQAIRVLKPGGHIVAFGGTRTVHRLACALEDAGFEIRDMLQWIYGTGFPKSLNVGMAIDKAARGYPQGGRDPLKRGGSSRPARNVLNMGGKDGKAPTGLSDDYVDRVLLTPDAERWAGWGTALKPAHEPIILARKPFKGTTVARNVLAHGTGALHIDACRVETTTGYVQPTGRWPANVILSHAADCGADACAPDCPLEALGHAASFYYCAKASKREREAGCEGLDAVQRGAKKRRNDHPTVKPVALMRWLVRLIVPPGGVVLDPFGGSGTTGVAALLEHRDCILIEREAPYVEIAAARIAHAARLAAAALEAAGGEE
jgi:DNA modification methylase